MYLVGFLAVLLGWMAVIIVVHEVGHAGAAVVFGFDDVRVEWFPPRTSYVGTTRWGRVILVSLAGFGANLVLGATCWAVAQLGAVSDANLSTLILVGGFFSIVFGACNLVPVPGSDGWTVLAAIRSMRR